jgi:hypothetical protein
MVACERCGADALPMANVALGAEGPSTYRCPNGHITRTDFRLSPQDGGRQSSEVADVPATPPPPPPPPVGGVAGSPPPS